MKIDCISDLHGHYPKLEGGDLLIVAGDLTARNNTEEYHQFFQWLCFQDYRKKILIAGNHDSRLGYYEIPKDRTDIEYLCDSGTEFEGLRIWGSPWTLWFREINPHCTAFTGTESELRIWFNLIPEKIDILITHGPPWSVLDKTTKDQNVGSLALLNEMIERKIFPKLWVCGHVHESYGKRIIGKDKCVIVNASHVDENYNPVNDPISIDLSVS